VFVVDTNVLVYAADEDSPHHAPCNALVRESRERASAWYVTWGICYEFLRVVTHPRVFRRPWSLGDAWSFLDALLAAPSLGVLVPGERHREVVAEVVREIPHLAGNLVHDAHTAVLMREHGVRRIYSRDTDFHRFPFLELVDPVARGS
jgi:toxin-antitoxin system PIN domain toxin